MLSSILFEHPITEPVYVFLVLLLVIFFSPKVLKLLRIPGIVGYILAGVALGPNGFNIIAKSGGIELFATIGLLYIMFLIGLEIDLMDFKKNRSKSFIFGAMTFFIPLIMGFFVCRYIIKLEFIPALLLASMFSTHTMISYPIVSRLGLARHRVTNIVAGGTIITDTAVLLLLAVIINTLHANHDPYFWFRMILSISLLVLILFWLFPKISKWLFRKLEGDAGGQYLLLLLVLFIAAWLAKRAGIEPMIGAFLAGIAMNRLVPSTSSLMNRTKFIGDTLFIPFFLVGVGMVVDLKVFLQGDQALFIALILIVVALISKFAAAWISQLIFGFKPVERNLMFGLSASHAAATIALILIGYNLGILDIYVLNGTVAVIFVSCIVSGFVTQSAGRRLAILDHTIQGPQPVNQRILVPLANPATMKQLLNLASLLKNPDSEEAIYPLSVIVGDIDSEVSKIQLRAMNQNVEHVLRDSDRPEVRFNSVTRVDLNVANGINRAIKELMITHVILGWNGKTSTLNFIFGTLLEGVLPRNNQAIAIAKLDHPVYGLKKVCVIFPPNAKYETGFKDVVHLIANFARQNTARILFIGNSENIRAIEKTKAQLHQNFITEYMTVEDYKELTAIEHQIRSSHLSIFVAARPRTLSYCNYIAHLPRTLSKSFPESDFIILYPEQTGGVTLPATRLTQQG
jgi:Kef-type K+ transport system membrane component KefB